MICVWRRQGRSARGQRLIIAGFHITGRVKIPAPAAHTSSKTWSSLRKILTNSSLGGLIVRSGGNTGTAGGALRTPAVPNFFGGKDPFTGICSSFGRTTLKAATEVHEPKQRQAGKVGVMCPDPDDLPLPHPNAQRRNHRTVQSRGCRVFALKIPMQARMPGGLKHFISGTGTHFLHRLDGK